MAKKHKRQPPKPQIVRQDRETVVVKRGQETYTFDYERASSEVKDSYVYFVFDHLELIYIGKGKGDRWKHTFSESTHNGFVRKAYKSSIANSDPAKYKTYIVRSDLPDSTALHIEKKWIKTLKPIGNIEDNPLYIKNQKGSNRLANNIKSRSDLAKGSSNKERIKKSVTTLKARKAAKKQWFKDNEERLSEEHLDSILLRDLINVGRF